jgi:hypothetical protein
MVTSSRLPMIRGPDNGDHATGRAKSKHARLLAGNLAAGCAPASVSRLKFAGSRRGLLLVCGKHCLVRGTQSWWRDGLAPGVR